MKKTATTIRCVPRLGHGYTEVRTIDVELAELDDEQELLETLQRWFAHRGLPDAVYSVEFDDNGCFAIINDEAYEKRWGEPLL